ncbi:MAG TPA: hypothetical protein VEO54_00745 [Thermoanaerobaculia bacterium]|nr:hypothetical protein [Thermoanaerobaculia bacterium]
MTRIVQWKQSPATARIEERKECDDGTYAYVLAGHGITDEHGVYRISLHDIVCDPPGIRHDSTPSITALTTYGRRGVSADARVGFVPHPFLLSAFVFGDEVTIHSFHVDARTPAPDVPFSWHMVFEGELVQ